MTAADAYRARVDAVLEQRTRLRGAQPEGDLFDGLPKNHPLLVSDPRRDLEPNLQVLASYIQPDDVIVDVGGGAGRYSLPLALRSKEVINVDPSAAMLAGFKANAARAGITNVRTVRSNWPAADPPRGSVALVNHVTYLTREIVPFLEALGKAASRRVLLTVNDPPPPSRHGVLYELLHREKEEVVPGHAEVTAVLRQMGIEPEVRDLPDSTVSQAAAPTRDAAVQSAITLAAGAQWAWWPLGDKQAARLRDIVESRFDELFEETPNGYRGTWAATGHEVLITWPTGDG
ncbi:MAG TPA: methyltransferase domain-containing protein [Chloroflexota bacterium]|nr:methyltransferase domain-containing protein [Chloroflexota bacterium]